MFTHNCIKRGNARNREWEVGGKGREVGSKERGRVGAGRIGGGVGWEQGELGEG